MLVPAAVADVLAAVGRAVVGEPRERRGLRPVDLPARQHGADHERERRA